MFCLYFSSLYNTGHFQIFMCIYTHISIYVDIKWTLNCRRYLWALLRNKDNRKQKTARKLAKSYIREKIKASFWHLHKFTSWYKAVIYPHFSSGDQAITQSSGTPASDRNRLWKIKRQRVQILRSKQWRLKQKIIFSTILETNYQNILTIKREFFLNNKDL